MILIVSMLYVFYNEMLSVEVFTIKQQLSINIFSFRVILSRQSKFSFGDSELRSNPKMAEKSIKILIECVYNDGLDDQVPPYNSPIQCCSPSMDGELVITTNQPFSWSSCIADCGERQIPCKMIIRYYQQCAVTKRSAVQDDYNVNCEAVQETCAT